MRGRPITPGTTPRYNLSNDNNHPLPVCLERMLPARDFLVSRLVFSTGDGGAPPVAGKAYWKSSPTDRPSWMRFMASPISGATDNTVRLLTF